MDLTAHADPRTQYSRSGPLAWNETRLLVFAPEGISSVVRASIRAMRVEPRSSFKHPIAGIIFGVSFVILPVSTFVGDPFGINLLLWGSAQGVGGAIALLLLGIYLILGVLRRHDMPWLVVQTESRRASFCTPRWKRGTGASHHRKARTW